MEEFGYELLREVRKPYQRYVGTKNKNTDISFLLWKKKDENSFQVSNSQ